MTKKVHKVGTKVSRYICFLFCVHFTALWNVVTCTSVMGKTGREFNSGSNEQTHTRIRYKKQRARARCSLSRLHRFFPQECRLKENPRRRHHCGDRGNGGTSNRWKIHTRGQ